MKFTFFKKHSTLAVGAAIVVVVVAGLAARGLSQKKAADTGSAQQPLVQLISLKNYSRSSHSFSANGTVESLQQVDLKAQTSGKITKISVGVGDHVRQGQVLTTVDQANAAAALTSAQGALAQAQAGYNKLLAGASNEDITVAQVALVSAQSALQNTMQQQQTAVSSALSSLINTGLAAIPASGNSSGVTATVTGTYVGNQQGNYQISIYQTGNGPHFQVSGLESGDGLVESTPQPLGTRGLFIQFSSVQVQANNTWTVSIPNTQAPGYEAASNAYQAALQNQTSAIAAAQNAVASAQAALDARRAQARPADLEAARAQILSAEGQGEEAAAAYENTLIKAPFDGTVSALAVKFADLVSPGQKIVTVVNEGGLEVKVFVSDTDLPFVHLGAAAQIGDAEASGTVTNLAPSVDATTRTAEVDIAVTNPQNSGLTVGQNVHVIIIGSSGQSQGNEYLLPLQAVKLTPDGKAYAYAIDGSSKAQEIAVTTGTIDGEMVEVTAGLENIQQIVSNAYDVSDGDTVIVHQ